MGTGKLLGSNFYHENTCCQKKIVGLQNFFCIKRQMKMALYVWKKDELDKLKRQLFIKFCYFMREMLLSGNYYITQLYSTKGGSVIKYEFVLIVNYYNLTSVKETDGFKFHHKHLFAK